MWPRLIAKQPTFETPPDLYGALGVSPGAAREEVDAAYQKTLGGFSDFAEVPHLAWKILRDPWYAELYRRNASLPYLYESGFFVDKIKPNETDRLEFSPGFMTTPLHKVMDNLSNVSKGETPIVLLTTGGFSPIHHGHIAMLEVAREELTRRGFKVVGGYFSPSHDDYVSTKYGGEGELNNDHRIHLAQMATQYSDWLLVDPWECRFVHTDINFTDVITRLKDYLNYYIKYDTPIDIFYVFGADNAAFSRIFINRGGCVCIARDGAGRFSVRDEEGVQDNPRIIFTENLSSYADASSSAARKWKANLMPEEVSSVYFKWRKNLLLAESMTLKPERLYIIRDEDMWALGPWIEKFGAGKVFTAKEIFKERFAQALRNVFSHVLMPDLPIQVEIRAYGLDEQMRYVEQLKKNERVLNLDMCTNEGMGVNLSRLFYLCDGQLRPSKLVGRPGFPDVEMQINAIESGEYTLLDDDIATGGTINMLMGILPENIKIKKMRTLMDYSHGMYLHRHPGSFNQEAFDVVDLRDFILGSRASGLVVGLPSGAVARAPYLQPYVSLVSRASIPPSSEMVLSEKLWELNLDFFSGMGTNVYISDFDPYVQKLFEYLGFPSTMPVADLCQWHLDKINIR
ncbi:hypothetical protein L0Y46_02700 [bacterium]|nr:hypothetical protein [bacterium]